MESGLPRFPRDFSCPAVLRIPLRVRSAFGYVAITLCGRLFQDVHLAVGLVTLLTRSYNPHMQAHGFGLFRFRSPLLSESRLIYFPPGTEMVHFPGLARTRLLDSAGRCPSLSDRVSPFGDPRIKACLRLPEAYRSLPRPSSPVGAKASTVRP